MSIEGRQVVSGSDFRNLSTRFKAESQAVLELQARISNTLGGSIWEGSARQNFQQDWDSQFVPMLRRLSESLDGLNQELNNRAAIADQLNSR